MNKKKILLMSIAVISALISGCFLLTWFAYGLSLLSIEIQDPKPFDFWGLFVWLISCCGFVLWVVSSCFLFDYADSMKKNKKKENS